MEGPCIKNLLDSISRFSRLHSINDIECDYIQRSLQDVEETLKYLGHLLEIITCDISLDEELTLLFEELNVIIVKAKELAECWHQRMSKVFFVLQFESVTRKLQDNLVETCDKISTLFVSLGMQYPFETVKLCTSKASYIAKQQISAIIRDAIQDQMKNVLPRSEHISKIGECLNLSTNQELLVEIVALDKLKVNASGEYSLSDVEYIDNMIALVTHMHDCYVDKHQVHSINNLPVPGDFCCPLSLDLMSDPVIVASGQTYERAFIRKWLDQGFTVCPKTHHTLQHLNLIPNYTVKALIASWCETNDIKLPDPIKSLNNLDHNLESSDHKKIHPSKSPEVDGVMMNFGKPHLSNGFSQGSVQNDKIGSSCQPLLLEHSSLWGEDRSVIVGSSVLVASDDGKLSVLGKKDDDSAGQSSNQRVSFCLPDVEAKDSSGSSSTSSACDNSGHSLDDVGSAASRVASDSSVSGNNASTETKPELPASAFKATELLPKLNELRPRNQAIWRRASDRFSPRIISSSVDMRPDLSGIETHVQKLIENLKSDSIDEQRNGATELRTLAKHSMQNRTVIANCGAITHLVGLLHSSDENIQENAITALLNLSLDDNNKIAIANADAIDSLIHVLKTGNPEAKGNSAATIYSLCVIEDNKARFGRSGAIVPLVDLLANGTPQGKRDAATALYNLSIFHENKVRIVLAGAVKYLVQLMDPAAGMVDKAVAVLSNLSTTAEGRSAIGRENGIQGLVEVVELGSARGKEHAAAALLQLCTSSIRFCNIVLQEGAVPPLVALSQSGTHRAKEKAQSLLSYFRNQRHGNSRRT